jgi:transcription-repair coupling factor (superfamily II helicase)
MYEEFISDFPYKITKDQTQTELDVLNDLSLEKPMNRIIVGDVGFGKTEIAMRGAFKMVEGGYQVAVLCPTTVLTTQHEKVFKERFSKFGIRVESLSRLNSTAVKSNLVDLENGKIDIIVGTHRLLSNDIRFKNLGMIIVDEEQKFGVKQKEKLKQIEIGVHVLSMSATPIPRSLSMALSSIQDISIIQTPPEGRKSIENVVTKLDQDRVKTAIAQELKRNGQVYYVHNKVETIQSKASQISKLLPKAKVIFAHGQMNPNTLMKNVSEFYEGKFDILVCTTIIENGLDMPNVNTIIVEHAQNFGLGQLYQLRGRVGRGDKQGYAYFFYDGDVLTDDDSELEANIKNPTYLKRFRERRKYRQRLKAIKESSELGAGFKLASRDLEIRGAGNLLGKQQHGNIKQIGYALYMQMLAEEIEKLKVSNETHD